MKRGHEVGKPIMDVFAKEQVKNPTWVCGTTLQDKFKGLKNKQNKASYSLPVVICRKAKKLFL